MSEAAQSPAFREDRILGGRIRLLQPSEGYRVAIDPVFLAAAVPAGPGDLVLELFAAGEDGAIDRGAEVSVLTDGARRRMKGGEHLRLRPGESVTLTPETWHAFWGENGDVLIGEVSTVNDDTTDNWFEKEIPRYTRITEDAAPVHLLVSDYAKFLGTD